MAYSELIKNFEKIRSYMREFYVFGFKSRNGYDRKSARSYDDERRRVESWLGDYMRFAKTAEGKNVFLSVDSRTACKPFLQGVESKEFYGRGYNSALCSVRYTLHSRNKADAVGACR